MIIKVIFWALRLSQTRGGKLELRHCSGRFLEMIAFLRVVPFMGQYHCVSAAQPDQLVQYQLEFPLADRRVLHRIDFRLGRLVRLDALEI